MSVILGFPGMTGLGRRLADLTGANLCEVAVHRFPDGESLVTVPENLEGEEVAILATLRDPDRLALQLRFAAATAREMGARRVGLAAPYLAYMRQDKRFAPGQAINAPLFAGFLEQSFDWIVTADPHLHRTGSLDDLFAMPAARIETAPLLASWIAAHVPDPVLVGPDSESRQWVAEVARLASCPFEVLEKHRTGDREVEISLPGNEALKGRTPVILDDIASSGRTMVRAVERLLDAGTRRPVCVAIHAVFAGSAEADIVAAGASRVVTTDSIPHASNAISIAEPLAKAVTAQFIRGADEPGDPENAR